MFSVNILIGIGFLAVLASAQQVPPPNECTGRRIGSFQPNVRDCSAFFYCNANGFADPGRCPSPYVFNRITQACDWAQNVQCFQCPVDQPVAQIAVEDSCNQFIRCIHLVPTFLTCPSDLLFDRTLRDCNLPNLVQCTVPEVNRCPVRDDPALPFMYPHPTNCSL